MTKGQMKTLLRKFVRDTPEVQFEDAELDEILNISYGHIQKELVKFNAGWHIAVDTIDVTSGTSWYPMPPSFGLKYLRFKATSGGDYLAIGKHNYLDIIGLTGSDHFYCREGQWLGIFPTPTATVSAGIELLHTPILALAEDDESPKIKTPLHLAIVYQAKLICLGETDESGEQTERRLKALIDDIPFWYHIDQDKPDMLQVMR